MREIGKDFSEKSKGLFSPEDWNCRNCGNINWARRNICNVCNTPRVNTQGQRTGYGGGFMERDEVVEYKNRRDSDDEFDEFGRKKKRFRRPNDRENGNGDTGELASSSNAETASAPAQHRPPTESESSDENEESGDDADLSKYDIWGAEDDAEETEKEKKTVPGPTVSGNAERTPHSSSSSSDSDSDSSTSSRSSSSSSSGSQGRGSRSSSASSSSASLHRASHSDASESKSRGSRPRDSRRRANADDKGHERSRSPMVARS